MNNFEFIKHHQAKKNYTCWLCGKQINIGDAYFERVSKYDGDFSSLKFHENCYCIFKEACDDFLHSSGELSYEFDRQSIKEWYIDNKCSICEHNNYKCSKCKGKLLSLICIYKRTDKTCEKYSCVETPNNICWGKDFIE